MSNQKRYTLVFLICVIALTILIFFEPSYGWRLRVWFAPRNIISSDDPTLPAQNEILQSQIAQLQVVESQIPQNPSNQIRAMVYSQYPFGFRNQLLVNAGFNQGVATGSAVTFNGIFVGTVQSVFANSATVQTVFDSSLKLPVRIGSHGAGVDALLVGGAAPQASSIAKGSSIAVGDIVYAAAPGLPYGLPVAIIAATTTSPDNLFEQASLNFAYDINSVQTVLIARQ